MEQAEAGHQARVLLVCYVCALAEPVNASETLLGIN